MITTSIASGGLAAFRRAAAVVVAACLLVPVLAIAGAAAQPAAGSRPTLEDVEVRDRLIADQESLLNAYRCLFGVDVVAVPERGAIQG